MTIETFTSPKNPLLRSVRRAVARGECTADGYCVAEGVHLLEEAIRSRAEIAAVIVSEPAQDHAAVSSARVRIIVVPTPVFQEIATTERSQGIISLVRVRPVSIDDLQPGLLVVLDGVQEPGNVGAIVRVAEAFGAAGVVGLKGTANPYNPKALRASAGSIFRVPCAHGIATDALLARRRRMFVTVPDRGAAIDRVVLLGDCAVVIGREGHGVSDALLDRCERITIPTHGVESLNAAVAAGIVLYEAQRQRGAQ